MLRWVNDNVFNALGDLIWAQVDNAGETRIGSYELTLNHRPQATVCYDRLCTRQPPSLFSRGAVSSTRCKVIQNQSQWPLKLQSVSTTCSFPLAILIEFLVRQVCHYKARASFHILMSGSAIRHMTGRNYGRSKNKIKRKQNRGRRGNIWWEEKMEKKRANISWRRGIYLLSFPLTSAKCKVNKSLGLFFCCCGFKTIYLWGTSKKARNWHFPSTFLIFHQR